MSWPSLFLETNISFENCEELCETLSNLERINTKPGLGRLRHLLRELGNPEKSFKSVLVGGTNGKGSTVKYLYNLFLASSLKAGCYTSPHLLHFSERIEANRREISKKELCLGLTTIQKSIKKMLNKGEEVPSPFELFTALAFWYFRKMKVEIAAVEVGLGGRLDATNIVEPELSIITNIGLDHQDVLGESVEEIAREKAGIMRRRKAVFTSAGGKALQVLASIAQELGSDLYLVCKKDETSLYREKEGIKLVPVEIHTCANKFFFSFNFEGEVFSSLATGLQGEHQCINASLACAAALYLKRKGILHFTEERMRDSLRKTKIRGRLEHLNSTHGKVLVDVAHNPDGAKVLSEYIKNWCGGKKLHLTAGFLRDKDFVSFLTFFSFADKITLVKNTSLRSWDEKQIQETIRKLNNLWRDREKPLLTYSKNSAEVFEKVWKKREKEMHYLVTGSHHTVRDFLNTLKTWFKDEKV